MCITYKSINISMTIYHLQGFTFLKQRFPKLRTPVMVILFTTFLLTGCLELEEKIEINKDKSGTATYSLKTDQAGSFINQLSGLFGNQINDQIKQEAEKLILQLRKQKGISDIRYELNSNTGNYFLQFGFQNPSSFNKALYGMGGQKKMFFSPGYIRICGSRFKRINFSKGLSHYLAREDIELSDEFLTGMLTFKTVIVTPEEPKKIKPSFAKKLAEKKAVEVQYSLGDIINNKVNTRIKIRY